MKTQAKSEKKTIKKREFNAFKVKTKGFKFNREEIYEELSHQNNELPQISDLLVENSE